MARCFHVQNVVHNRAATIAHAKYPVAVHHAAHHVHHAHHAQILDVAVIAVAIHQIAMIAVIHTPKHALQTLNLELV